jgi:formate-dependent nitrite reductase membrane component NrfD
VIFVVVGLLAVVLGIYEMSRGLARPEPFMPGLFGGPDLEGMLLPLRIMFGGIVSLQGLMLAALGEALWLVASLAQNSQKSSEHLASLAARGSLTIP